LSHTNQFHQQEQAWLKVLNEFNSKNLQTKRTLEQVKAKFDNLKTKARKEVGEKKSILNELVVDQLLITI
jgi:molecular chaperone GrpE (heat shock protein)